MEDWAALHRLADEKEEQRRGDGRFLSRLFNQKIFA
jgi:hypothetical protein